jgi:hypothetical protein
MTSQECTRSMLIRLIKLKWLMLICGLISALFLFLLARSIPAKYTARATVFPLNAGNDNAGAASALTNLLGLPETPKSFVQEASINIVDLALSRSTREAVAKTAVPQKGNKLVADLVIEEYNRYKKFYQPRISIPKGEKYIQQLSASGAGLLNERFFAKINKNGILEINCTFIDPELAGAVAYIFVDKISTFYKELKIKKAKLDYDFVSAKVDSLQGEIESVDGSSIGYSKKMLFVPEDKLQYRMPIQNNTNEKSRINRQRDITIDNKEEALWRLQKVTPIIEILDRPDPPYIVSKPSKILYAFLGFFAGSLLFAFISTVGIFFRFLNLKIKQFTA